LKVLLLANYIPDSQQSMQKIAALFEDGLRKRGVHLDIARPEQVFLRRGSSTAGLNKFLGYIDKYLVFPWKLKSIAKEYDIVHILDHSNAIYAPFLKDVPKVVTCHDMLAIRSALGDFSVNPIGWSGRLLQGRILKGLKTVDCFVCVSYATREDFLRLTKREGENTFTVYSGLNFEYYPIGKEKAQKILIQNGMNFLGPFLVNVGKNNWYKNRSGLIEMFKRIAFSGKSSHSLVIAGEPLTERLRNRIIQYGLNGRVVEVPGPSNWLLRALYSGAEGLIYPSIAEGFGWPIVEAQACGCPVFTTGRPPMTEAGGDAAVYFDPADPASCAKTIIETLKDPEKVREMREKGLENAKRFNSGDMVNKYIQIYRELLRNGCKK